MVMLIWRKAARPVPNHAKARLKDVAYRNRDLETVVYRNGDL